MFGGMSSDPISVEITNCYQVMKLFKEIDLGKFLKLPASTFKIIVEEIMKDEEFKKSKTPAQKSTFLG